MAAFFASQDSFIEARMQECQLKASFLDQRADSDIAQASTPSTTSLPSRDRGRWIEAHFGKGAGYAYRWLRSHYFYVRDDRPRIRSLVQLIRQDDIDLVHFNNSLRTAKAAIQAARITGIPCVCHVRNFTALSPYDLRFAGAVDLFVFISRAIEQDCRRQGISQPGILAYDGVDLNEFPRPDQDDGTPDHVRTEFGWESGTPMVGVVGRLDWWKGHETFLEAVAQASTQIDNLKALIVGAPVDTPQSQRYYQDLQALTRSLGLEDKVVFTGFRSDVSRLMSAMDVVVLSSSRPEPFGLVVIEGMATCKPVIATAAGGALDIIRDGVDGRLVPIQDASAMSRAILELVLDTEKAKQMGQAARRRVESHFTVSRHIATMDQVYSTLLDTPARERARIQWQHVLDTHKPESHPSL